MRKLLIIFLLTTGCFIGPAWAERVGVEKEILKEKPKFEAEKEKIYVHSFYEYSWIKQGARKGNWRFWTNRIALLNDNLQSVYLDSSMYERLGIKDNSLDVGAYFKLKRGYIHTGIGFGTDHIDYIYRFKSFIELEQQLVKNLNVNIDTRFLDYAAGNVYIFSPGLVYYFGNNYVSSSYGISFTEGRGSAQYGTFRGNFALTEKINLWTGMAFGERLYDILTLKASKQFGSIFFFGADININRNITFRVGASYSKERPSFIKRSIDFGARIKF